MEESQVDGEALEHEYDEYEESEEEAPVYDYEKSDGAFGPPSSESVEEEATVTGATDAAGRKRCGSFDLEALAYLPHSERETSSGDPTECSSQERFAVSSSAEGDDTDEGKDAAGDDSDWQHPEEPDSDNASTPEEAEVPGEARGGLTAEQYHITLSEFYLKPEVSCLKLCYIILIFSENTFISTHYSVPGSGRLR